MNKTGVLVTIAFIVIVAVTRALTSCCTSICKQGAPDLREMPEHGIYVIEDVIEIPVERTGK